MRLKPASQRGCGDLGLVRLLDEVAECNSSSLVLIQELVMESLLLRSELSVTRQSSHGSKCISKSQEHYGIGAVRFVVRARRGDGGEGSRLGVIKEEDAVGEKRRPLWQRAWGFGGRTLGFGETWEVDPREQRELEEFDLFLEGKGLGFQWKDVLETSVENLLALILTLLFLYAVTLIGWQLLLVTAAITLSALKYAVIAAIVVGLLIFFI